VAAMAYAFRKMMSSKSGRADNSNGCQKKSKHDLVFRILRLLSASTGAVCGRLEVLFSAQSFDIPYCFYGSDQSKNSSLELICTVDKKI
jgi:hypothetical protein